MYMYTVATYNVLSYSIYKYFGATVLIKLLVDTTGVILHNMYVGTYVVVCTTVFYSHWYP